VKSGNCVIGQRTAVTDIHARGREPALSLPRVARATRGGVLQASFLPKRVFSTGRDVTSYVSPAVSKGLAENHLRGLVSRNTLEKFFPPKLAVCTSCPVTLTSLPCPGTP
jgi:hypothetical protein